MASASSGARGWRPSPLGGCGAVSSARGLPLWRHLAQPFSPICRSEAGAGANIGRSRISQARRPLHARSLADGSKGPHGRRFAPSGQSRPRARRGARPVPCADGSACLSRPHRIAAQGRCAALGAFGRQGGGNGGGHSTPPSGWSKRICQTPPSAAPVVPAPAGPASVPCRCCQAMAQKFKT